MRLHGIASGVSCECNGQALGGERSTLMKILLVNDYGTSVGGAEVLTFAAYFEDARFKAKKPIWKHGIPLVRRCGDNCYRPLAGGGYRQLPSGHYDHKHSREDEANKKKFAELFGG